MRYAVVAALAAAAALVLAWLAARDGAAAQDARSDVEVAGAEAGVTPELLDPGLVALAPPGYPDEDAR